MGEVWKEGSQFQETVRHGGVTLVVGCPGSGKTEATSVLASIAKADGGATHVVGRCNRLAEPVEDGEIDKRLSQSVREAKEGDLVIGREVFECDNVNFHKLINLARKRNVTVVVEMQTADFGAVRDDGCDVLVMRMMPPARFANTLPDLAPKDIARISNFRPGEGILLSRGQKPKGVRVEMLRSALAS